MCVTIKMLLFNNIIDIYVFKMKTFKVDFNNENCWKMNMIISHKY